MARRHDLVGLTVLALLSVRASHPYELHRFILDTHKDYITGLPRSLYNVAEWLRWGVPPANRFFIGFAGRTRQAFADGLSAVGTRLGCATRLT